MSDQIGTRTPYQCKDHRSKLQQTCQRREAKIELNRRSSFSQHIYESPGKFTAPFSPGVEISSPVTLNMETSNILFRTDNGLTLDVDRDLYTILTLINKHAPRKAAIPSLNISMCNYIGNLVGNASEERINPFIRSNSCSTVSTANTSPNEHIMKNRYYSYQIE